MTNILYLSYNPAQPIKASVFDALLITFCQQLAKWPVGWSNRAKSS